MSSEHKYELLAESEGANALDVSSAAPPAYQATTQRCTATNAIPLPPLPNLDENGDMVLTTRPVPNIVLAIVFFFFGMFFMMPLLIFADDDTLTAEDDDSLLFFGLFGPLIFWIPAMLFLLLGKTKAVVVSSSERTITLKEYPLLRCAGRNGRIEKVLNFDHMRACVLTVDTGLINPWVRNMRWPRTQQPHTGAEPQGAVSLLDVNGVYHDILGGRIGGVGRYARTYVALTQYLRAIGALPVESNAQTASASAASSLCTNCAGSLGGNNDDRYIRLVAAEIQC